MKCEKCGSEDLEIKIVDIKNEKAEAPVTSIILILSWIFAVASGGYIATILFSGGEASKDFWEAVAGTLVDGIETIILWKVFSASVVSIIVCTLYIKLLPYKVIPVKKAVCKSCGNEQDDTE